MTRPSAWCLAIVLLLSAGCGPPQTRPETAAVHEVRIEEDVTPALLYVHRGDEVRWQNRRSEAVRLGLLGTTWRDHVVCQKGFSHFGQLDDLVTIAPQEYVSLCFANAGTIRYNVWLDPDDLIASMTPTSTIRVD